MDKILFSAFFLLFFCVLHIFLLTKPANCGIKNLQTADIMHKEITLKIPAKEYGPIATAAALAKKPIDRFVVEGVTPAKEEKP